MATQKIGVKICQKLDRSTITISVPLISYCMLVTCYLRKVDDKSD